MSSPLIVFMHTNFDHNFNNCSHIKHSHSQEGFVVNGENTEQNVILHGWIICNSCSLYISYIIHLYQAECSKVI